jgi:hypothetical protein
MELLRSECQVVVYYQASREEIFYCFKYGNVAIDKGSMCQLLVANDKGKDAPILMFRPIANTFKRLWFGQVDMIVNNIVQNWSS